MKASKTMRIGAGVLAGGLTALAPARGVPMRGGMVGMAPPESEVTRIADSYAAAINRGDAAAMAAVYADDGVEMPPGKAAVRGRAAIEAYHRQELSGPVRLSDFSLTATDTRVTGDVAYTTGTSRYHGHASGRRSAGTELRQVRRRLPQAGRRLEGRVRDLQRGRAVRPVRIDARGVTAASLRFSRRRGGPRGRPLTESLTRPMPRREGAGRKPRPYANRGARPPSGNSGDKP